MHPLWYRTAYEQGPPVPSPVAWQEALMIYDQQPCRSSKKGCSPCMKTGTDLHRLATYGWTPSQPLQQRVHPLQRAHHEQEVSLGPPHGVPADLPCLKMCTPPGKVAFPRTPARYVSPMAGVALMLEVDAGVGAVAGAPPAEPDAAARAPAEPKAVAAAPLEPEAVAVTPELVNGRVALKDRDEQPKPPGTKPNMHEVARMLREKMNADKLARKEERDALKVKEEQAAALKKKEEQEAGALAMEVATATAQKTVAVTGKAKAAPKKLVKVVAAKAAPKAAAKAAAKAVAKAVPSGSCPDDSLFYRGTAYHHVRYYKKSTVYLDAVRHQWRVKPCTGSRQTIRKSFKTNPKQAWEELVDLVRKLNP